MQFNNYLSDKTDSKFSSRNTLTDLNRVRQNDNRQFEFSLIFEPAEIVAQARLFSTFITATGIFESSFMNNANRVGQAGVLIARAYVYSYIKSVYYAFQLTENASSAVMGPGSNTVFTGHKLLHDIICEGYIQHFTPPNNVISIELNPPSDTLEQLESFDLWSEVYDPTIQRVFNSELETILNFLKTKHSSLVTLGSISGPCSEEVKNLMRLPIGNLCYSSDALSLLYVECEALVSNKQSFYWNKANMISALRIPPIDADDSIYDTILTQYYDLNGRTFEVEAITGFNPLGGPRNAFDYTRNSSPNGHPPNRGGGGYRTNPNPGNPNNRPGSNNRGPQSNPRSNQQTKMQMAKNSVSKVSGKVASIVRRVDEILTPERVELVSDIIQTITGKRPKLKTIKQYTGERLGKVLEDNGIILNDNLVGSDEEYEAFYVDSEYINGQYKSELVGVQRTIAPS
jgi:hypothetical protein